MTLEDVVMELNVPIDREHITNVSSGDLVSLYRQLLGLVPPKTEVMENPIKLYWLNNSFHEMLDKANEVIIAQHARAYI